MAVIVGLCLIFRIFAGLGADALLNTLFQSAVSDGELVLSTVLSQSALLSVNTSGTKPVQTAEADKTGAQEPFSETEDFDEDIASIGGESAAPGEADIQETSITGSDDGTYLSADGIYVKNATNYEVDIESLLNQGLNLALEGPEAPQVLILHTHGSEAYTPDGDDVYTESDPYRTEDTAYNVVKVGDALQTVLESHGVNVLHDRELYDYPSYIGSYGRSLDAISWYLEQYPSIKVVVDLHRDALEGQDGTVYKTVAEVDGGSTAQIMLVVGTDAAGLTHPAWTSNLQFALRLQLAMNQTYPGLARPVAVKEHRYNQHMTAGSLIVEVGSTGNTLQEAISSVQYFGECLAGVLQADS